MASIMLPTSPGIRSAKARLLDFGGVLTPALGGSSQRLNRLGNRFAVDYEMPLMRSEPDGRGWVAALAQAQTAGAIMRFPQPDLVIGAPGTPLVDAAGQLGSVINLKGFAVGYVMRAGQFFSIITGGRRYLHGATADTVAGSDGKMALPIFPMLRVSPSSGATCEVAQPMIEGWLSGQDMPWEVQLERTTNLAFTITEAA